MVRRSTYVPSLDLIYLSIIIDSSVCAPVEDSLELGHTQVIEWIEDLIGPNDLKSKITSPAPRNELTHSHILY